MRPIYFMLEISPIPPYPETIKYPRLGATGAIELQAERPSIFSVCTAGLVLDEAPLDLPIPFLAAEDNGIPEVRTLGFTITQVGDRFFMPRTVAFYQHLASQMLGALLSQSTNPPRLTEHYSFYMEEIDMAASLPQGDVHYDASASTDTDRAALVSNLYPTWYSLQRLNRFKRMNDYEFGMEWKEIPPEALWCPQPKEITIQEGGTPHGRPDFPVGVPLTRRLASLRVATGLLEPSEVSRIEVDDSLYREEDLQSLAIEN